MAIVPYILWPFSCDLDGPTSSSVHIFEPNIGLSLFEKYSIFIKIFTFTFAFKVQTMKSLQKTQGPHCTVRLGRASVAFATLEPNKMSMYNIHCSWLDVIVVSSVTFRGGVTILLGGSFECTARQWTVCGTLGGGHQE